MPTTAFSKTFNGEFQVNQLENLHKSNMEKLNLSPDFRTFVKMDVKCPCCNVEKAVVVSEGYSANSKVPVKQAHFAFKNNDGVDSHLKFCDFYTGKDKEVMVTNDCLVRFRESNDLVTQIIRKFICAGIENSIFSQSEILSMRQWFFELKSSKSLYIEESRIEIKVLREMLHNEYKGKKSYKFINNQDEFFNIDEEVYKFLSHKLPKIGLPDRNKIEDNWNYYLLTRKTITDKAIRISVKDDKTYTYDRNLLKDEYRKAAHVAYKIIISNPELKNKYGRNAHTKASKVNSIMAYAALLLFISDWDVDAAIKMHHDKIASINEVKNMDLGNAIGINPFVYYQEWTVLKFVSEWKKNFEKFDLNHEFEMAKKELLEYYYSE